METSDMTRHQTIRNITAQHPDKVADAAIAIWEPVAAEIISVIGEGGFNTLYARSLFLTQSTFPWLAASPPPAQPEHRFAQLKMTLEGQTPAQGSAANCLLLITFTDILAALIGEPLTASILRLAWGSEKLLAGHSNDALDQAGRKKRLSRQPKEFKNE